MKSICTLLYQLCLSVTQTQHAPHITGPHPHIPAHTSDLGSWLKGPRTQNSQRRLSGDPMWNVVCHQHWRYLGPFPCCHLKLRVRALSSVGTMGTQLIFHHLSLFPSSALKNPGGILCLLLSLH